MSRTGEHFFPEAHGLPPNGARDRVLGSDGAEQVIIQVIPPPHKREALYFDFKMAAAGEKPPGKD